MWQILLLLLCSCNATNAEILKCEIPGANLYYTDRNCKAAGTETILPCQTKTLTSKEINALEKQLNKSRNAAHKRALQQEKRKLAALKQQERDRQRRLRSKAKCETLMRRIAELNQKYKEGYTVQQGIALDRKLSSYNELRQKICNE